MKNYLTALLIATSFPCFAFQDYTAVHCSPNIKGLKLYVDYNRSSSMLTIESRGEAAQHKASEKGNRIITEPETDDKGNSISAEIWSNEDNWQAIFSVANNEKLLISIPFTCRPIKASEIKSSQTKENSHGFEKLAAKLIG